MAWRLDADGGLIAFSGRACTGIELDGLLYAWAETPIDVAWHPLGPEHSAAEYTPLYRVWCGTEGTVQLPLGLQLPLYITEGYRHDFQERTD